MVDDASSTLNYVSPTVMRPNIPVWLNRLLHVGLLVALAGMGAAMVLPPGIGGMPSMSFSTHHAITLVLCLLATGIAGYAGWFLCRRKCQQQIPYLLYVIVMGAGALSCAVSTVVSLF